MLSVTLFLEGSSVLRLFSFLFLSALPALAQAVPYQFHNVAIVGGGLLTGLIAHPGENGLRYARTDIGGAYRWSEGGKRWLPLEDFLPFAERNLLGVESLAIDPQDPKKLYLAAGTYTDARTPDGAILRSNDQGQHFEIVHLPVKMGGNEEGRTAGERLQVDPNHGQTLLLGTRLQGLWRSENGGAAWARVGDFPAQPLSNLGLTFVLFDKASEQPGQPTPVIFVGVHDPMINLLWSPDAGRSWKPVLGGPVGMFPNHGALGADGLLYLSYTDTPGPNGVTDGAVWVLNPRTGKFRDITPEKPGGFGYGSVAADPTHSGVVFASTLDRWGAGDTIFRTTDGGAHWRSLKETASRDAGLAPWLKHTAAEAPFGHWIGALAIDPFDPAHVLYGTGETVWESHDVRGGPTHWAVGAEGIEETAVRTLLSPAYRSEEGPHLFSGLADIGCFRHDDLNRTPAGGALKNPELRDCDAITAAFRSPRDMVRVGRTWEKGSAHGAVSHDGGAHWTPFPTEPTGAERGGDAAISTDGKTVIWAVRGGPVVETEDNGGRWRTLIPAAGRLQVLADAREPGAFYLYDATEGSLRTVASNGAVEQTGRPAPKGGRLRLTPDQPGYLWIAGDAGLFRSGNEGVSWQKRPEVAAAYALGFGKGSPAEGEIPAMYMAGVLAGTPEAGAPKPGQSRGGGIYRSLDGGAHWQRIDTPEQRFGWVEEITGDPRVFGRVYLGTNGRGVWWGEPAGK